MGWIHEGLDGQGACVCPTCGKHDAKESCPVQEEEYKRRMEEHRNSKLIRKATFEESPLAPTDDKRKVYVGGFDGSSPKIVPFHKLARKAEQEGKPYRLFDGKYRTSSEDYGHVPGEGE